MHHIMSKCCEKEGSHDSVVFCPAFPSTMKREALICQDTCENQCVAPLCESGARGPPTQVHLPDLVDGGPRWEHLGISDTLDLFPVAVWPVGVRTDEVVRAGTWKPSAIPPGGEVLVWIWFINAQPRQKICASATMKPDQAVRSRGRSGRCSKMDQQRRHGNDKRPIVSFKQVRCK